MARAPITARFPRDIAFAVRLLGTALVFGYLLTCVSLQSVVTSVRNVPIGSVLGAFGLVLFAATVALVRWRLLLRAYGAGTLPAFGESACIFGGALFYNLLPGAVGGDVYRGCATRHCFPDAAVARSVGVVFVDRVLGLAGLFLLVALATLTSSRVNREFFACALLGTGAAISLVFGVSLGRRLAPRLPAFLGKMAKQLPQVEHTQYLLAAIALSVFTHLLVSFAGYVLICSQTENIRAADAFITFPLGTLASYFPFSVAGAGARDGALVFLFSKLAVARQSVLATSLCLLGCDVTVAALGGLLHATTTRGSSADVELTDDTLVTAPPGMPVQDPTPRTDAR